MFGLGVSRLTRPVVQGGAKDLRSARRAPHYTVSIYSSPNRLEAPMPTDLDLLLTVVRTRGIAPVADLLGLPPLVVAGAALETTTMRPASRQKLFRRLSERRARLRAMVKHLPESPRLKAHEDSHA